MNVRHETPEDIVIAMQQKCTTAIDTLTRIARLLDEIDELSDQLDRARSEECMTARRRVQHWLKLTRSDRDETAESAHWLDDRLSDLRMTVRKEMQNGVPL